MGVFDISHLDSDTSKSLFSDALAMTTYSYHNLDHGLAWGYQQYGFTLSLPATLVTALFGNGKSQGIAPNIPWNPDSEALAKTQLNDAGWYVLSADELGYHGKTDARGTFYGEKAGYRTAQAEVMGKYDEAGNLIQIGITFRGTSGPRESLILDTAGDIINDLQTAFASREFAETYALQAFGDLLDVVAQYSLRHGLSGENVVVSGHSLGGVAVNSMAAQSDTAYNGFYSASHYVAFASLTQYELHDKVLNAGFENDPVFRTLDGMDFKLSSLFVHDKEHVTTTDNIVNFNDYYASDLWNVTPQSIADLSAWISHMPFFYQQGMARILDSAFYSLTERDSTIVVSTLSDATRGSTWVEDLNRYAQKHTGPTFILGSDGDDLIKGGSGNNYLEGGKGNDTFRLGGGYNIVLGGDGNDTIDLQGKLSNSEIAWDGETLYLRDKAGAITLAKDVENIQSCENFLLLLNQKVTHQVTDAGLKSGNKLTHYADSISGSAGDDALLGKSGGWLFGLDGNDTLIGRGNNTFVGGAGDDTFFSAGKNNTFLFSGDFGNDTLYNLQKSDKLVFLGVEGATHGNYRDYATQQGSDVVLNLGDNSVTLVGVAMDMLNNDMVVMA